MRGLLLVLEGVDGSGKSSQIEMLAEYFQKVGMKVAAMHFPRVYEQPYGVMVGALLRGEFGVNVDPHFAALLFSLDRLHAAPELRARVKRGEVVILDRYVYSNIAYQTAKVADPERRRILGDWIEELEFKHHDLLRPDLALFLDAPLEFTLANLAEKREGADREYLRGKKDIHESDLNLQIKVRHEFLAYAGKPGSDLQVVACSNASGGMATPNVVKRRILEFLRLRGMAVQ